MGGDTQCGDTGPPGGFHIHLGAAPTPRPLPHRGPFLSRSETQLTVPFLQEALPDNQPIRDPPWGPTVLGFHPPSPDLTVVSLLPPFPATRGQRSGTQQGPPSRQLAQGFAQALLRGSGVTFLNQGTHPSGGVHTPLPAHGDRRPPKAWSASL